MTSPIRALISWVSPAKGGRKSPPPGPRYISPVRLISQSGRGTDGEWSLVVDFEKSFGGGFFTYASISFLVPEAPLELLSTGARFELHEGRRLVATGIVSAAEITPADVTQFEAVLLH